MTPEEILRELRDIHLPEMEAAASSTPLILWPALLVFVFGVIVLLLIWRRRAIWRADLLDGLDDIEASVKAGRQREAWAGLASLLKRLAIRQNGRDQVARLSGDAWLRKLDEMIEVNVFTEGPGRRLISAPYEGHLADQGNQANRSADLQTVIDSLRKRLKPFGVRR